MKIVYWYNINLKNNNNLNFEDLFIRILVIIRYKKFLVALIQSKEIDLVNKYIHSINNLSLS